MSADVTTSVSEELSWGKIAYRIANYQETTDSSAIFFSDTNFPSSYPYMDITYTTAAGVPFTRTITGVGF
jgi:hypothetical protein